MRKIWVVGVLLFIVFRAFSGGVVANTIDLEYQYQYTGSGDDYFRIEKPEEGFGIMKIAGNNSERHFAVVGYNDQGKSTKLFVNTTQPYVGTVLLDLSEDDDTSFLEVNATGAWTIFILPIGFATFVPVPSTFSGSGDDVIVIRDDSAVLARIDGNQTSKHFAVIGHGRGSSLMVNTTSPYSGTVRVSPGTRVLEIKAVGKWSVEIE